MDWRNAQEQKNQFDEGMGRVCLHKSNALHVFELGEMKTLRENIKQNKFY